MGNHYRSKSTDKFLKGIVQTENPAAGYEDPTYLGFRLRFNFDGGDVSAESLLSTDPLFTKAGGNGDSAEGYLRAIGMNNRANAIKEFGEAMKRLVDDTPYYIQSIDGMNDIWKIQGGEKDAFNNFRTAGKALTFECLESIDLRMTALADLYRKATFDEYYMRELLPENLKWFSMTVDIAEIRNFHTVKQSLVSGGGGVESATGEAKFEFADLDSLISIMSFRFQKCMFDFSESFPMKDTIMMGGGEANQATSRFKVHAGSVTERNYFTLLNYILDSKETYTKITAGKKYEPGQNLANKDRGDAHLGTRVQGYYNGVGSGVLGRIAALGNEAIAQGGDRAREIIGAPQTLLARGIDKAQALATGGLLGNVYSDRNKTIAELISPFLDQGNAQDLLSVGDSVYKKQGPPVDSNINEDVYPSDRPVPPTDLGDVYE